MIKIYQDEINKSNKEPIEIEIRKKKYQQDYQMWIQNIHNFPEKMYFIFSKYLERKFADTDERVCFIDVGAAEGLYSISAANILKNPVIACFEPEYERFLVLAENLKNRKNMADFHVHQKMVSNTTSDSEPLIVWNYIGVNAISAGSATPVTEVRDHTNPTRYGTKIFHMATTLDEFAESYDKIDIVKIDVEGGEIKVFEGAAKMIKEHKPTIFLELHNSERFDFCTIDKVKNALGDVANEYKFTLIDSHHGELEYYVITPIKE